MSKASPSSPFLSRPKGHSNSLPWHHDLESLAGRPLFSGCQSVGWTETPGFIGFLRFFLGFVQIFLSFLRVFLGLPRLFEVFLVFQVFEDQPSNDETPPSLAPARGRRPKDHDRPLLRRNKDFEASRNLLLLPRLAHCQVSATCLFTFGGVKRPCSHVFLLLAILVWVMVAQKKTLPQVVYLSKAIGVLG